MPAVGSSNVVDCEEGVRHRGIIPRLSNKVLARRPEGRDDPKSERDMEMDVDVRIEIWGLICFWGLINFKFEFELELNDAKRVKVKPSVLPISSTRARVDLPTTPQVLFLQYLGSSRESTSTSTGRIILVSISKG